MAMNDFNIGFIGSLDGTKSKRKIEQDIDAIKGNLKDLELKAKINPNQIKVIENQLNTLKVNLHDVTISQSTLNGLVAQINNALKGIQIPNINIGGSNGGNILGNNIAKLEEFRKSLSNIGMSSADIDAVAQRIERLNVDITSLNQSLSHTSGAKGDRNLLNIEIGGIDKFGQAVKLTQTWDMDLRELIKDVDAVSSATQKAGTSANNFVEKQKKAVTDLTNQINQIYKSAVDPNASKPIKSSTNLVNLENKYNDIITAIGKMGNASETTFADERNSVNTLISDLKIVIREYKNAETAATSMRSKDVGTIKSVKTNELDEFIAKIQNSKVPIKEMRTEISNLKTSLSSIHDTDSLTAYLNQFDIANSKFKSLKEQFAKSDSISSVIFNASDLDQQGKVYIQKVRNTIEAIKPALESKLRNAGYTDIEIKGVEDAKGKIKSLTATVTDATGAFKQLNFERAKIQGGGKAQAGFVQTDDVKVVGNISSAIDKVQNNLFSLKTKWEEQGVLVGEFKTKVEQLESSLSSVGSKGELNGLKTQIQDLKNEASTLSHINEIQLLSNGGIKNDYPTQIAKLEGNFRSLGLAEDEIQKKTSNVASAFDALKTRVNQPFDESNYQEIISLNDKLQNELIESGNEYTKLQSSAKGYVSIQQRLSKANTIEAWNQKNSAATKQVISANEAYIASLRDLNSQMTRMQFNEISDEFKKTENSMRSLGRLGASLKDQMSQAAQSFTQWLSVSSVIMALVYQLKKIPQEVIKVNSAMVELNKVSDASASDIKKYFDEAADSAKKYGSAVSDMINATADWSRLGYNLPDSKKLAEIATLYTNVGDGIDMSTANEHLISTLQGFQLEAEDALGIIDRFNEVNLIAS